MYFPFSFVESGCIRCHESAPRMSASGIALRFQSAYALSLPCFRGYASQKIRKGLLYTLSPFGGKGVRSGSDSEGDGEEVSFRLTGIGVLVNPIETGRLLSWCV